MNYFDQENSYSDFSYTNYPKAINLNDNIYDYSATNNITYYNTNLSKPIYNRSSDLLNENALKRSANNTDLNIALEMIKNSVMDELNDEAFYTILMNQAMNNDDREIIESIRDDETKHNKLLRDIYYSLTGITLPMSNMANHVEPMTYIENLKKALISETNAAAKYMKILNAMKDRKHYQDILEILVDELRHGINYNLLITRAMHNITENREEEKRNVKDEVIEEINNVNDKV